VPRRPQPDTIARLPLVRDDVAVRDRIFFASYYLLAFAALGYIVSHRRPTIVDTWAQPLAGIGVPLASAISWFGTFPVYFTISLVLLVLGIIKTPYLRGVLISISTLVVAWQVSDACKAIFHRPRPEYWFGFHEPSFSYPSGHATLIVAFYGFWTFVAWASPLPLAAKRWIRLAFAALAIAIGWSRLALGAHFFSDVVGGYLLGAGFASLGMLVYRLLGPDDG